MEKGGGMTSFGDEIFFFSVVDFLVVYGSG